MIGTMRERVIVQAPTDTLDSFGGGVGTFQDILTVFASVESLGSSELWRAQQAQSDATYRVTIRHLSWLTEKHSFLWGDRRLNIESIIDTGGRHRWQQCLCREGREGA